MPRGAASCVARGAHPARGATARGAFIARARADIQRERDAAIQEVRSHFGDLAITAAERVIRRSLDRRAHQELVAQVLEEAEAPMRHRD